MLIWKSINSALINNALFAGFKMGNLERTVVLLVAVCWTMRSNVIAGEIQDNNFVLLFPQQKKTTMLRTFET